MSKPKYDYLGERIDNDYYTKKQSKRDLDAITFLKWIAFLCGAVLAISFLIQLFKQVK